MTTITFGSGGTYTNPYTAYTSLPSTFVDDYLLLQVGTVSSYSGTMNNLNTDYAGYTLIMQGNGDKITCSSTFFKAGGPSTGNVYIQDFNFVLGSRFFETSSTTSPSNDFEFHFRRNNITGEGAVAATVALELSMYTGFSKSYIYANNIKIVKSNATIWFIWLDGYKGGATEDVYIEDNFFEYNSTSTTNYFVYSDGVIYQAGALSLTFKRNYVNTTNATLTNTHTYLSDMSGLMTDTYTNANCSDFSVAHVGILFTVDNFLSIGESDNLYGVPKLGSVVYDDATQDTGILENVVGLNGISIGPNSHRAAGPYTPPILVNPPTGVLAEYTGTGVKITWTDSVLNNPGYESVYIYYETVSVESAFTIPKDTVVGGTQTYTIPYTELSTAPVWYVRLQHGA